MSQIIRKVIQTANAPKPVGPYSQAVKVGDTVYVSGVLGLDKDTMKLVPGGAASETDRALQNLGAVLEAADSNYSKVVKSTIFLEDINDFTVVNDKYKEIFKEPFPARSTFQVGKLPLMLISQENKMAEDGCTYSIRNMSQGAKVEIEVIAISGNLVTK